MADHINLSPHDRDVLRRLVEEQARAAELPVQREKAELWRRLNDLAPVRPMVWINEIPWHEMDVDGELTLQCRDPWLREVETELRRQLYQWRHLPADMIVSDHVPCAVVIHSTGFGLREEVEIARTDAASDIVSREFHRQIVEPEDVAKIRNPVVTVDWELTHARRDALQRAIGDILPVRLVGKKGIWYAPWDELIRWWGVEDALRDLVDRPEMVEAAITRLTDAYLSELDQWEALGLLTPNADNTRHGSGGYGYTAALPAAGPEVGAAPATMWGSATAQIFGSVSPRMHWEFGLKHELRWLERWGLDLLRVLRAARREGGHPESHPQPAQGVVQPVGEQRARGGCLRRALRAVAQTDAGVHGRGCLAARCGARRSGRIPRTGARLRGRGDHEGCVHGALSTAAVVGVGADGDGGGGRVEVFGPRRRAKNTY